MTTTTTPQVPHLVGSDWTSGQTDRFGEVFNPSTGQVIAQVPYATVDEVEQVIKTAADALPGWSATPVVERARVMYRYRELLEENFEELAKLITKEHGKTLPEARAEVRRGIEVVEFSTGIPSLIMGQTLPDIARNVDAQTVRHPVGVCVGITPYSFPAMVPMWMYPVSIMCGNTFILKPSEKTPLSAVRLGELLVEANLPAGVFNIIHGDKPVVDTLLTSPTVKAISFVGSSPIAKYIYETGTKHGKRVQAAGGAKNHLIIMPDANMDLAVKATAGSAFGCSGQRCMAGSVAVAVGGEQNQFAKHMADYAGSLKVGPTETDESIDVGPVIRQQHADKVASYLDIAKEDGADVTLDGRSHAGLDSSEAFLIGPSVVDQVTPDMRVWKEEIFGPLLSVVQAKDIDEALAVGDQCEFGNGAVIFTNDGYAARTFKHHFNAGMIGVNVGVPAPMAWMPFTGWNGSFFGDLHIQGTESIQFYTQSKMTLTRWYKPVGDTHDDGVWKTK